MLSIAWGDVTTELTITSYRCVQITPSNASFNAGLNLYEEQVWVIHNPEMHGDSLFSEQATKTTKHDTIWTNTLDLYSDRGLRRRPPVHSALRTATSRSCNTPSVKWRMALDAWTGLANRQSHVAGEEVAIVDYRLHIEFWSWSRRFIVGSATLAVMLLVLIAAALKVGYAVLAYLLLALFTVVVVGATTLYVCRLYRVRCPECKETMITSQQAVQSRYVARCRRCEQIWVLRDIAHG